MMMMMLPRISLGTRGRRDSQGCENIHGQHTVTGSREAELTFGSCFRCRRRVLSGPRTFYTRLAGPIALEESRASETHLTHLRQRLFLVDSFLYLAQRGSGDATP
jgi:hypothetical protein